MLTTTWCNIFIAVMVTGILFETSVGGIESDQESCGTSSCAPNAHCSNQGVCECDLGFVGYGETLCIGLFANITQNQGNIGLPTNQLQCFADSDCHTSAQCVGGLCKCGDNFVGDGVNSCMFFSGWKTVPALGLCGDSQITCHRNASCVNGSCKCDDGFLGDGIGVCFDGSDKGLEVGGNSCTQENAQRCNVFASCVNNICRCNRGWIGDGVEVCLQEEEQYFITDECKDEDCHENARCIEMCVCNAGYSGDGINSCIRDQVGDYNNQAPKTTRKKRPKKPQITTTTLPKTSALSTNPSKVTSPKMIPVTGEETTTTELRTTNLRRTSSFSTTISAATTATVTDAPSVTKIESTIASEPTTFGKGRCKEWKIEPVPEDGIILTFPSTFLGKTSFSLEECQADKGRNSSPMASAYCNENGVWEEKSLFRLECGIDIESLQVVDDELNAAMNLELLTSNFKDMSIDDAISALKIINKLSQADQISYQMSSAIVGTIGNLVQSQLLKKNEDTEMLLKSLDKVAESVVLPENGSFRKTTKWLNVIVSQRSIDSGIGQVVTDNNDEEFNIDQFRITNSMVEAERGKSQIFIPDNIGGERVSFLAFMKPDTFTVTEKYKNPNTKVNSMIISASTLNGHGKTFSKNISMTFSLNEKFSINQSESGVKTFHDAASCRYWAGKYWSISGCWMDVNKSSSEIVVCHCNHLTSFAAIFDFSNCIQKNRLLNIFTVVGCGLSAACLLCTIVMFIGVRALHSKSKFRSAFLIVNLAIALLGLDVVILVSEGVATVVKEGGASCTAIACLTHFFLISAFAWMNCEAVNIYIAVVMPLYSRGCIHTKNIVSFSVLWGWIMPAMFVGIVAGVDISVYKRDSSECGFDTSNVIATCWLRSDMVVNLVVIPAALMIAGNVLSYIVVTKATIKNSIKNEKVQNKTARIQESWKTITLSISVMTAVGVTWLLGFLVTVHVVFSYIFVILNTAQGCFLFGLFIVRNKTARTFAKHEVMNMMETGSSNTKKKKEINTTSQKNTTT